jgi:hypothetical protein
MSSGRRPDLRTVTRPAQYNMQNHNVKSMETTDMVIAATRDLHTLHPTAARLRRSFCMEIDTPAAAPTDPRRATPQVHLTHTHTYHMQCGEEPPTAPSPAIMTNQPHAQRSLDRSSHEAFYLLNRHFG